MPTRLAIGEKAGHGADRSAPARGFRPSFQQLPMRSARSRIPDAAFTPSVLAPDTARRWNDRRLVVQHDVVGAGHGDEEGCAGHRQQVIRSSIVVLIGLGMVWCNRRHQPNGRPTTWRRIDLRARREMICLPSIEIFRPDKADDSVDQQRIKKRGDRIGARFPSAADRQRDGRWP